MFEEEAVLFTKPTVTVSECKGSSYWKVVNRAIVSHILK